MNMSKTHEMGQRMFEEARADVTHADQKASVLLAALGIGFGAVLGGQLSAGWDSSSLSTFGQVLWWIGVAVAVLSVAAAALAIWPRYRLDAQPKHGVAYWGQLWHMSRLVLKKYQFVRLQSPWQRHRRCYSAWLPSSSDNPHPREPDGSGPDTAPKTTERPVGDALIYVDES